MEKIVNANEILFRCSSLSHIMTEERGGSNLTENQLNKIKELSEKSNKTDKQQSELDELIKRRDLPPSLSESCITHLADVYVSKKYGRNTEIESRYTNKGLMVEEDSLTLYSRFKKRIFTKNEERLNNFWIAGTPDVIKEHIVDAKSSWDIFTFFRQNIKKLNKNYYWQMQGYMDLTGSETSTLAYCLIDTPEVLINDMKRKLLWKMGALTELDADYIKACEEIDLLMKYEDIPMNEKVIEIEIKRNQSDIDKMHKRVEQCREYININFFKIQP